MHADSLFTSLGGERDLACTECSSSVEIRAAVSIKNSSFEQPIAESGSVYMRVFKGGTVRLENNEYRPGTDLFELDNTVDAGDGVQFPLASCLYHVC